MTDEGDLVEGRIRRGRALILGAIGAAVLVALRVVFDLLEPQRPATRPGPPPPGPVSLLPTSTTVATDLSGRLVYTGVDPNDSGVPRLVALDLASGTYEVGPEVRNVDASAQLVAVGPGRSWLLILRMVPGRATYVADLLRDLGDEPQEVARGGWIDPSPDGRELLVTRVVVGDQTRRCPATGLLPSGVTIDRVDIVTGRSRSVHRGIPACNGVEGAVWYGSDALLLDVRRGRSDDLDLLRDGERTRLFAGVVASASSGTYAFVLHRFELLVWPGGGALRPIVTGERTLGRVASASASGRYVVVDGTIRRQSGLWIVDVAAGVVNLGPDRLPSRFRIFAEAVADDGTVFLVGYDGIVAVHGQSVGPVALPPGAPMPVLGPVAWMP